MPDPRHHDPRRVDPRLLDAAARQAVRERLDESLVVEAGAGTGKTHALVDRVEALIVSGRARIEQIVAITFTRAAAAELRERIRSRFEELSRNARDDPQFVSRIDAALEGLDGAAIQTIDAFALALLRERPLDAGLPPRLDPLDEVEAALAFADRWQGWLDRALDGDLGAHVASAVRLGLERPFDALEEIARSFHDNYDLLAGLQFQAPPPAPRRAAREVADSRAEARAILRSAHPGAAGEVAEGLRLAIEIAERVEAAGTQGDEARSILARSPRLKQTRGRQDEWGRLPDGRWAVGAAKSLLDDLQRAIDSELETARAAAFVPLLQACSSFVSEYARERRDAGTPEFHDLLVWANELLSNRHGQGEGDARRFLRDRYRFVLIDEFQDTDPLQTELALSLTGRTDGSITPGALFVVGDPKQSIYRFRRADLSSLRRVRDATRNDPVNLTITRRTHDGLVRWVNAAFGSWMGRKGDTTQATYVDLVSDRAGQDGAGTGAWRIGGEIDAPNLDLVRRAERQHIVDVARSVGSHEWTVTERDGQRLTVRQSNFSDLCILFPNRTSLPDLERALEEAGIPYTVEGQTLAFGSQELRDFVSCLAAIDDPSDAVATVAALRSPVFGCSDVDLYDWARQGRRFAYLALTAADSGPDAGPVGQALAVLRRYHVERPNDSASLVVERFIRELRLREMALDGGRERERWRLLSIVAEQARALAEAGRGSLRELVRWCEERRERQERSADGGVAELDVDAVRLMTVHYAKGLEFPIVLLTGLSGRRGPERTRVRFDHSVVSGLHRRLAVKMDDFVYGDYADLASRERLANEDETVRLMYVAATRARDHLIVSLYRKSRDATGLAAQLVSHIGEQSPLWQELAYQRRPAPVPGGQHALTQGTAESVADRDAWIARRSEVLVDATRPFTVAATALVGPDTASTVDARGTPTRLEGAVATAADDEPWRRGRGGTSVGRAVHAALQDVDLGTGRDLEAICERHADAEALGDAGDRVDVVRLVRATVDLDLVRQAASSRHWKEVYVAAPLQTLGGGVIEGFVDLVFEDASGDLTVIDYKTDRLPHGATLERSTRPYRLQVGAYAHAVETATRRRVAAAWIVFARRAADGLPAAYRLPDLESAKRQATIAAFEATAIGLHGSSEQ